MSYLKAFDDEEIDKENEKLLMEPIVQFNLEISRFAS